MKSRTATKVFGGVVATLVLALTATAAPADAASPNGDRVSVQKRDTGWDIP